jgi:transposase
VIRIDAIWLAVEPMDMRAGTESALGRVVAVFGSAQPHHAYVFLNRRGDRMKTLVCDGFGVWLAARRCTKAASREPRSQATWHSRGCSSMR